MAGKTQKWGYRLYAGVVLVVLLLGLWLTAGIALAGSAAPNSPTNSTALTPTATCTASWNIITSPSIGAQDNFLFGIAVVSASDIWAVGAYYDDNFVSQTLIEHWDGSAWSVVPSPSPDSLSNVLQGVAAVSPNDVWAVGSTSFASQTLTEHWDGSTWSVVPSPNADGNGSTFNAVVATASNDIWAVGYFYTFDVVQQTLIEHWDGTAWSLTASPNVGTGNNVLYAASATSANDIWAVGSAADEFGVQRTLTEHWDGTAWSIKPSANNPDETDNVLYGISARSSTDAWAVGYYFSTSGPTQNLIEHWDGTAWSIVPSPNVGLFSNSLNAVSMVSANDIWAVGDRYNSSGNTFTISVHWDGTSWTYVPTIDGGSDNILYGVGAVSAADVWAVGQAYNGTANRTLTERYTNPCSNPTPVIVGHVTWQGRPVQPNALQQLPITLTVKLGTTEVNYPATTTDPSGFFTVPVGSLPNGTYNWRAKHPKYLANAGTLTLSGDPVTNVEIGFMRTGDCNDSNVVNSVDFNILRGAFGKTIGDPGYDDRADFDGNQTVNVVDFNLLKSNFGQSGAPPILPR